VVPAFQVRLPVVGLHDVQVGELPAVGDQRVAAVGRGVAADLLVVDGDGHLPVPGGDLLVRGGGAGPPGAGLLEVPGSLLGDVAGHPAFGAAAGDRGGRGLVHRALLLDPAARSGEPVVEVTDRGGRLGDAPLAGGGVTVLLGAVVHPHDGEPLGGRPGRPHGGDDLAGVAEAFAGPADDLDEAGVVADRPGPELRVFLAGAGQHGDEQAVVAVDVAHRRLGGQLAVRDIDEVGAAGEGDQVVPGRHVGGVVAGVAVGQAVQHRDRAVGCHGQDVHQLLEVGPVVLGVPVGDRGRRSPGDLPPGRADVVAVHADGGRVVVELTHIDAELADDGDHQLGEQAGAVGVKQLAEHPARRGPCRAITVSWVVAFGWIGETFP